jgi:trans-2,3-dihydro-3-hydroxyanthranilate isomerase
MPYPLAILDVFAESALEGNQLAVVSDAGPLSTEAMQSIAREMNYSETTFVTDREPRDGGYDVRIFTPTLELPFAGHPTLGTAWWIRNELAPGAKRVVLNLGVGAVPVDFDSDDMPWLTAPPIAFGPTFEHADVAPALGLDVSDLDNRYPVQRLDAGIVVVTVALRNGSALQRSQLQIERFRDVVDQPFPAVHLFCREPDSNKNDLCARFFFDAQGPREDPATGSATACLGAFLLEHDVLGKREFSLRVEQGAQIDRPSLLFLRGRDGDGAREIQVGGHVIPSVRGELL